ncbi:hypothetical protein CHARACLAT_021552 [Characodon lateralis]|uniref:Uncharacterized protein n=1 Tax=Characodon lateralis TaxID=208331 RepID=A0ABU7ELD7_9TELE|nr:hypothetical protein [Characodon lateralis]
MDTWSNITEGPGQMGGCLFADERLKSTADGTSNEPGPVRLQERAWIQFSVLYSDNPQQRPDPRESSKLVAALLLIRLDLRPDVSCCRFDSDPTQMFAPHLRWMFSFSSALQTGI